MLALRFSDALAPQLNADPRWSKYLAMLIIYAGTSLFVWLAFRVVSGTIDRIKLREFDRQIGGLFGLLKGALFCVIITFFAVTLTESSRAAVLKSKSGGHIARLSERSEARDAAAALRDCSDPTLDKLDKGLDPTQTVEHPQIPNSGRPARRNAEPESSERRLCRRSSIRRGRPTRTIRQAASQPATYPPPYDYQSGQNVAPRNR